MSATNATANYNLPLFIGTDKPAWLTDWNGAMNSIDSAIANVASSAGGTATDLSALTLTVSGLSSTVSDHTTSISTLTTAVSGNTGSINTINSLIGNGQPTTTDKTIIGAINELHAEIGGGSSVTASAVSYDGTTSGLTADDVQEAIDELAAAIPTVTKPTAADVSYSNTASGLTASNVQAAIDELAQSGAGSPTLKGTSSGTSKLTHMQSLATVFSGLTDNEKIGSYIVAEPVGQIYRYSSTAGCYECLYRNATNSNCQIEVLDFGNSHVYLSINGAAFANTHETDSTDAGFAFKLYA